jgi:hypothetical protein
MSSYAVTTAITGQKFSISDMLLAGRRSAVEGILFSGAIKGLSVLGKYKVISNIGTSITRAMPVVNTIRSAVASFVGVGNSAFWASTSGAVLRTGIITGLSVAGFSAYYHEEIKAGGLKAFGYVAAQAIVTGLMLSYQLSPIGMKFIKNPMGNINTMAIAEEENFLIFGRRLFTIKGPGAGLIASSL